MRRVDFGYKLALAPPGVESKPVVVHTESTASYAFHRHGNYVHPDHPGVEEHYHGERQPEPMPEPPPPEGTATHGERVELVVGAPIMFTQELVDDAAAIVAADLALLNQKLDPPAETLPEALRRTMARVLNRDKLVASKPPPDPADIEAEDTYWEQYYAELGGDIERDGR